MSYILLNNLEICGLLGGEFANPLVVSQFNMFFYLFFYFIIRNQDSTKVLYFFLCVSFFFFRFTINNRQNNVLLFSSYVNHKSATGLCVSSIYLCWTKKRYKTPCIYLKAGCFFYWLLNLGTKNNQIRHRPLMVKYEVLAFNLAL